MIKFAEGVALLVILAGGSLWLANQPSVRSNAEVTIAEMGYEPPCATRADPFDDIGQASRCVSAVDVYAKILDKDTALRPARSLANKRKAEDAYAAVNKRFLLSGYKYSPSDDPSQAGAK